MTSAAANDPNDAAILRALIEQETAGWDDASLQRLHDVIEQMDAPNGWRPFYCDRPHCDGRPHDNWSWEHARWDQHPPQDWRDAYILCILSGRGSGKTRMGAEWVHRLAKNYPGCYIGMIAPTVDSARDVLVEGESGILRTAHPAFQPIWEPSKRKVTWPNGSSAQTFSADMPERLRGPQHGYLWLDEAGSFKNFEDTWSNALFGLRLGDAPKVLITTTPRPREWLRKMVADPQVITRRVSTYANVHNLAETYRTTVIRRYENTALGQQELEGVILDDDFGEALWQEEDIVTGPLPTSDELGWHVISVDPAVTSGGDETGIITAAATAERDPAMRRAVVTGDHTVTHGGPEIWVRRVIDVYRMTPQPCSVVIEANQGGELIGGMIHQLAADIPVTYVRAHRSKEVRADPIVLAYRMGRVKHLAGVDLSALADQMCTWIPGVSKESPGRIDALVWAIHSLLIDPKVLKAYGRIRVASQVTDIREFAVRRSAALDSVSDSWAIQRAGLRPPILTAPPQPEEGSVG